MKCVYIHAGDQPFEVDAAGQPINERFYLEDASGPVLGLADETGPTLIFMVVT